MEKKKTTGPTSRDFLKTRDNNKINMENFEIKKNSFYNKNYELITKQRKGFLIWYQNYVKKNKNKDQFVANCQFENNNELPIVTLNVKNQKFNALIDSGASISICGTSTFQQIKQIDTKISYLSRNVNIVTLSNQKIPFK